MDLEREQQLFDTIVDIKNDIKGLRRRIEINEKVEAILKERFSIISMFLPRFWYCYKDKERMKLYKEENDALEGATKKLDLYGIDKETVQYLDSLSPYNIVKEIRHLIENEQTVNH